MGHSGVIDIDRGMRKLKQTLRSLRHRGSYVKVGVLGQKASEQHDDGLTNADVAAINEFGTATIPARPFISSTYDVNRENYVRMLAAGLAKVYENKLEVKTLLGRMGAKMAADVKNRVTSRDNNFTPNAPSTMRRKANKASAHHEGIGPLESPRPLVDTGRMIDSVTWEVVEQESETAQSFEGARVEEREGQEGGGEE